MLPLFKALADNTRLRLIAILDRGEFTVQELVDILSMGQSRVSRHLKILAEAGIIDVKREGTWAYYRLEPSSALFNAQLPLLRRHFPELEGASADSERITTVLAERRQRSQAFFEQHAKEWDRLVNDLLPTPDYLATLLETLEEYGLLVEIGIGTGTLLADLSRISSRVIGVDHAPAMLQLARERLSERNLQNVELRLGEMEHLPLESAEADVALLNMVLHHAASPETVLNEVARVLRPGGRLLIFDLRRHHEEWVRDKLADQWLGFECEELVEWCQCAGFGRSECHVIGGVTGQHSVLWLDAYKTQEI